jgi:hypothetical protein
MTDDGSAFLKVKTVGNQKHGLCHLFLMVPNEFHVTCLPCHNGEELSLILFRQGYGRTGHSKRLNTTTFAKRLRHKPPRSQRGLEIAGFQLAPRLPSRL